METVQGTIDHPLRQNLDDRARKRRVQYLDLARGMAIFLMILQHSVIMYAVDEGENDLLGKLFLLLGRVAAAPVFLLIMGIFSARSKEGGFGRGLARGFRLILLGYGLNFVRFCIPVLAGAEFLGLRGEPADFLFCLGTVDILQMAGLSLIVLALLRKYVPNARVWLAAACLVLILSPYLRGRWSQIPGTQLLWGIGENIFFPLFPWLFYPLLGMALSDRLRDPRQLSSRWMFCRGGLLLGSGLLMLVLAGLGWFGLGDYFRSSVTEHLIIIGFVFLWLGLCRFLAKKSPDNRLFGVLKYWSLHVTVIYIVQWILIGWGTLILDSNTLGSQIALSIGLAVVLVTHLGIWSGSVVYARFLGWPEPGGHST